jgi:uncharacterized protein (DUF2147 family)
MMLITVIFSIFLSVSSVSGTEEDKILGRWWSEKKDAQIEIYKCESRICAKISALRELRYPSTDPRGMAGELKVDRENPDSAKRTKPLVGLQLLSGFVYSGKNIWANGTFYNPDDGKTFEARLILEKPDRLKVRAFRWTTFFGKTQYWMRVDQKYLIDTSVKK